MQSNKKKKWFYCLSLTVFSCLPLKLFALDGEFLFGGEGKSDLSKSSISEKSESAPSKKTVAQRSSDKRPNSRDSRDEEEQSDRRNYSRNSRSLGLVVSAGYSQLKGFDIYGNGKTKLTGFSLGAGVSYKPLYLSVKPPLGRELAPILYSGLIYQRTTGKNEKTLSTVKITYSNLSLNVSLGLHYVVVPKLTIELLGNAGFVFFNDFAFKSTSGNVTYTDKISLHYYYGGSAGVFTDYYGTDVGLFGVYNMHRLKIDDLGIKYKTSYNEMSINLVVRYFIR